jgi:hypothetical protein
MNWKRGLIRVWIVGSIAWALFVAWLAYSARSGAFTQEACFKAHEANPALGNPFDCFDSGHYFDDLIPLSSFIERYIAIALAPSLAALLLGFVIAWVAAGFKHQL